MATNNCWDCTRHDIFIDFEILATVSFERLIRFVQTKMHLTPLVKTKLFCSQIFSVKLWKLSLFLIKHFWITNWSLAALPLEISKFWRKFPHPVRTVTLLRAHYLPIGGITDYPLCRTLRRFFVLLITLPLYVLESWNLFWWVIGGRTINLF